MLGVENESHLRQFRGEPFVQITRLSEKVGNDRKHFARFRLVVSMARDAARAR